MCDQRCVNIMQKMRQTFDGWQENIEQLATRCHSLPPITIDTGKVDAKIAAQAKCSLNTKSVSHAATAVTATETFQLDFNQQMDHHLFLKKGLKNESHKQV